jgi:hypothetical protein
MHKEEKDRNLTIRIPESTHNQIKKHPEVNWSTILRAAIDGFLNNQLELTTTPDGPRLTPTRRKP